MPKKFLGWVLVAVAAVVPLAASAQQQGGTFQAPQVYVQNIHIAENTVFQGDTVHGTFVLQNQGTTNASNIGYRISLVGNYQPNTLAGTFYDTSALKGSVFVPANGSVTVPFTYTLSPGVVGSGKGIQIQAYTSAGIPLGWSDDHITINPKQGIVVPPSLAITNAQLKLGTSTFPLQAGPVVHVGEHPTLIITLGSSTTQSVIPYVALYNRVIMGTPLQAATGTPIAITHKTFSISLPLPTTAGVYDTRVILANIAGVQLAAPLDIRYIVAGDIVTIQSLTSNVTSVSANSPFVLTLQYTGSPFDIRTGAVANQSTSTLTVTVANELGTTIATSQGPLDPAGGSLTIPLTASADATAMTATATVTNNGKVIATYSTNLSPNVAAARAKALATSTTSPWFYIILSIVLLVFIFIIIRMLKKKKLSTTPLVIFAVMAVAGVTLFSGAGVAKAWSFNPNAVSIAVPALKNLSGVQSTTFAPGQNFVFTGTVYVSACVNESPNVNFYFLNPTNTQNYQSATTYVGYQSPTPPNPIQLTTHYTFFNTINYNSGYGGEGGTTYTYQFADPFTAPTTPGTYSISLHIEAEQYFDNEWGGATSISTASYTGPIPSGYGNEYNIGDATLTYTVVPPPTATLTASGNGVTKNFVSSTFNSYTVELGSPVTLTWSSANATECQAVQASSPFTTNGAPNGSAVVTPPSVGDYSYSVTCSNSSGASPYSSPGVGLWVVNSPPPPTCPTGATLNSTTNTCVCSSGTWDSTTNTCVPPPSTPPSISSFSIDSTNVCNPKLVWSATSQNGTCTMSNSLNDPAWIGQLPLSSSNNYTGSGSTVIGQGFTPTQLNGATYTLSCSNNSNSPVSKTVTLSIPATCTNANGTGGQNNNFFPF